MNLIGILSSSTIETTTPPLEVPSSFVSTIPVTPTASLNPFAWFTTFWPCVASTTRSTSLGLFGIFFSNTPRTFSSSFMRLMLVCRRPLVSAISTSAESDNDASMASYMTAAGDLALERGAITDPDRVAHSSSCMSAAARKVSPAASMTVLPSAVSLAASFPIVVVLPPPFTPTIISTAGFSSSRSRALVPPLSRISTIFSFMRPRSSLASLTSPLFIASRSSSQIFTAVPTPKSRVIRASSRRSSVPSVSSRFQKLRSSSMTDMSLRMLSSPEKSRLVRSTSAFAFSTSVRVNLEKKLSCI
mmetsp:Transcript_10705/g.22106  ORF Transcript_10705/g.22106 Transcript_10705/m.22106 type:complete len:302 (+) Transcript_10705:208-1113(+)